MPKKLITPDTPLGNNDLASKPMWAERTLYRDMSHEFKPYDFVDMWYGEGLPPGKMLYGRVDPMGDSVFLAEENLKQLPNTGSSTIFVLNFVADAWDDFTAFWNGKIVERGYVKKESPFYNISPKQGWISPHKIFHMKQSDEYEQLTTHKLYLSTHWDDQIVNFEGFLKFYLSFCQKITPTVPVTRAQWLVSRYASPLFSGLMIEVQEGMSHGDDMVKQQGFVDDEVYDLWVQAAMRYGFVVDKNAPWRLIADINSAPMKRYLGKYGVKSLKAVFKSYYATALYSDIEVLRQYMRNMYKSFIVSNPNVKRRVPSPTLKDEAAYKLVQRTTLTDKEFDEKYPPRWWIRHYVYIRARETARKWDQTRFEMVVKNAQKKEKHINMDAALEYINRVCGGFRQQVHGYKSLDSQDIEEVLRTRSTKFRGGTFNF